MSISQMAKKAVIRYPRLGPVLFISSVQYFLIQLIVGQRFTPSYSLKHNTISDLGNTTCAVFSGRMICSPLHFLMNVSFFALGVAMIFGSLLFYYQFASDKSSRIGFSLFGISGFGVLLVALFPENTVSALHGIGAALPFLVGNVSLVLVGHRLHMPKFLRFYTLFSGVLALTALVIYSSGHFVGLGEGGIERVVAYPQTLWMIVIGAYFYLYGSRRDELKRAHSD